MNQLEFSKDLSISVCDSDEIYRSMIKSLLERSSYTNIKLQSSPEEVLYLFDTEDYHSLPNIVIIDTDSDSEAISSIEAAEIIKNNSPQTIVICISSGKTETTDVPLRALAVGCDSWVDKDKDDFLGRLMARVSHWVSYIEERKKLAALYDVLSGGSEEQRG